MLHHLKGLIHFTLQVTKRLKLRLHLVSHILTSTSFEKFQQNKLKRQNQEETHTRCSNEMLKVQPTCLLSGLCQRLRLLGVVMDRNRAVLGTGVRILVGGTITSWHLKMSNN